MKKDKGMHSWKTVGLVKYICHKKDKGAQEGSNICFSSEVSKFRSNFALIFASMHYAARAMGAMSLRISELCLSFSPHPNISDGNFNFVQHFFLMQIFQINEKGFS